MSADKRSVSTDALATLGTIITEGGRDAIHLAVEPVEAGEKLYAGQDIGIKDGKAFHWGHCSKSLGIVDPFLKEPVNLGQKFWLIVYPRQITSLRHVWEHPDFEIKETEQPKSLSVDSEEWLRDWCSKNDCPDWLTVKAALLGEHVEVVEGYGEAYSNEGEYLLFRGRNAHASIPLEFWEHFEKATGKRVKQYDFFSCTC